ncbi:hypothetical protein CsatB_005988 [Cannabis sativa]
MVLNLDMSKAYDCIEWAFLEAMRLKMGFNISWVALIMTSVSSVKYNVVHGLSTLIQRFEQRQWIYGCKIARGAPSVSHMLFADDSYLYCQASEEEASRVMSLLHKFEVASGQKVNLAKSLIFFNNNIDASVRQRIMAITGMVQADEHSKYLGLPSTMGRNKNDVLGFLKEKVRKRVEGWDEFLLNIGGIPLRVKEGVLLGKVGIIWWLTNMLGAWVLGKQAWRLLTNENSLVGRIFKAKYYPNGSYVTASLGQNPSFVWHNLFKAQTLIKTGCRWCIADGMSDTVLDQAWLPHSKNPFITSDHPEFEGINVQQLMVTGSFFGVRTVGVLSLVSFLDFLLTPTTVVEEEFVEVTLDLQDEDTILL